MLSHLSLSFALVLALAASRGASLTAATRPAAGVPCSSSSALTYLPGHSLEYGEINDGGDMHFYECEKTVTLHLEGEKGGETSGTKGREAGTEGGTEGGKGERGSGRFYEFSLFGAADNAAAMEAAREFIHKHSFDGRDDPACAIAADTTTASSSSSSSSSSSRRTSASSNAATATAAAAAAAADVCLSRRIVEAARSSPGGGRRVPIRSPRWRVQDTFLFLPRQASSISSSASSAISASTSTSAFTSAAASSATSASSASLALTPTAARRALHFSFQGATAGGLRTAAVFFCARHGITTVRNTEGNTSTGTVDMSCADHVAGQAAGREFTWAPTCATATFPRYKIGHYLNERGLTGQAVEVGVQRGINARALLDSCSSSSSSSSSSGCGPLLLIDPWSNQPRVCKVTC